MINGLKFSLLERFLRIQKATICFSCDILRILMDPAKHFSEFTVLTNFAYFLIFQSVPDRNYLLNPGEIYSCKSATHHKFTLPRLTRYLSLLCSHSRSYLKVVSSRHSNLNLELNSANSPAELRLQVCDITHIIEMKNPDPTLNSNLSILRETSFK